MPERTVEISERDRWLIVIVALAIVPKNFAETRLLNRVWDAFEVDQWDGAKKIGDLGTEPKSVSCQADALRFLLSQFEPTLGRMTPPLPLPPKTIANEFMELHERLSKA